MSPSEVHAAIKRAAGAGLVDISDPEKRRVNYRGFYSFLVHGVPRSFAVKPGPIVRGMPTAHAAAPLSKIIAGLDDLPPVWPDPDGKTRGYELKPIYKAAPGAAKRDPKLYELLSLVDALRAGRARERRAAAAELRRRLLREAEPLVPIGPLGVTENEIAAWTDSYTGAEAILPDLIRRLVLFLIPPNVLAGARFPAHKAISEPGYDGELRTNGPSIFANTEASVWELSTQRDARLKANKDFAGRTENPLGRDKQATTYVAVTSRIWRDPDKSRWQQEKHDESEWADVRIYDAVDIAHWLTQAPPVQAWFCSAIGRPMDDIDTVDEYFDRWAGRTAPDIDEKIVLVGRDNERNSMREWLFGLPRPFIVSADSVEESTVFFCASIRTAADPEKSNWLSRTIIVKSAQAWQQALKTAASRPNLPLVIVPAFPDFDGSLAGAEPHYVYVPRERGPTCTADEANTELGPVPREPLAAALREFVPDADEAKRLAYDSGGKLLVLQRLLGYAPPLPDWAKTADTNVLSSLLLVGSWTPGNQHDSNILAEVAGCDKKDVEQLTLRLMSVPDPPLRRQGQIVKWRSGVDAWLRLVGVLSASSIERFRDTCIAVLGKASPAYDLPPAERMYAGVRNAVLPESGAVREGLADGLAYLRRHAGAIPAAVRPVQAVATVENIVRHVLHGNWKVWATLSQQLPVLAEAAPAEFLSAIEEAMRDSNRSFRELFAQDSREAGIFSDCAHSGLLWALEGLAWHPDHFPRVVCILAQLCKLDERGQYSNRPDATLRSLFHPLVRQSSSPNSQRINVLRELNKRNKDLVWMLVRGVLETCAHGGSVSCNHRPRFCDWVLPESLEQYPQQEIAEYIEEIRDLARDLIARNTERLLDLFEHGGAPMMMKDIFAYIRLHAEELRAEESMRLTRLQNALRKWVSHQYLRSQESETQPDGVESALELIGKLDSVDSVVRPIWLFAQQVVLPDRIECADDWRKRDQIVENMRAAALTNLLCEPDGLGRVVLLADRASEPRLVGTTLASLPDSERYEGFILAGPLVGEGGRKRMALGFIGQRSLTAGMKWLIPFVERLLHEISEDVAVEVLVSLRSTPEIRDWVDAQGGRIRQEYWRRASMGVPSVRDDEDFRRIVDGILEAHRWSESIELARWALHDSPPKGRPEDYLRILAHAEQGCTNDELAEGRRHQSESYVIPKIFRHLDEFGNVSKPDLARLESFYIEVLEDSERPPKYITRAIEENPQFFAELVSAVFRPASKDERAPDISEVERKAREQRAHVAFRILHAWTGYPGEGRPRDERDADLKRWCDAALDLVKADDREIVGQHQIGEMLRRVPKDESDGVWPCRVAREYIEGGFVEIARGMQTARFNSRGVVTKSLGEGGKQEREIAESYQADADKIRDTYPLTAAMLGNMAQGYLGLAEHADGDAEEFTDP